MKLHYNVMEIIMEITYNGSEIVIELSHYTINIKMALWCCIMEMTLHARYNVVEITS